MLDPDAALKILEEVELTPQVEVVPIAEALGRVLAQAVRACAPGLIHLPFPRRPWTGLPFSQRIPPTAIKSWR